MPELPEVEVVRRGLSDHVVGRRVVGAAFIGPRVARRHLAGPDDLARRIEGHTIAAARRRGKYLWLVLTSSDRSVGGLALGDQLALIVHLGMSGQLLVQSPSAPTEKHLHARIRFADGGSELRFVDQRTFGGFALDEVDDVGVPIGLGHIAADPCDPAYDQRAVVRRLKGADRAIKRALLDQGVVSGIGNIYADEALWRAQVHGERHASSLTKPTLGRILDHARNVMSAALAQGGTSFDALYVNVNGASGMPETERNVPGCILSLGARRSLCFGGACLRTLSPSVPPVPAKTLVEARRAISHGHIGRCSFRSLRTATGQFGQLRRVARGIELDRAVRMSAPGVVWHRHGAGLRTLRGGAHA